jgi:hypothetical protein
MRGTHIKRKPSVSQMRKAMRSAHRRVASFPQRARDLGLSGLGGESLSGMPDAFPGALLVVCCGSRDLTREETRTRYVRWIVGSALWDSRDSRTSPRYCGSSSESSRICWSFCFRLESQGSHIARSWPLFGPRDAIEKHPLSFSTWHARHFGMHRNTGRVRKVWRGFWCRKFITIIEVNSSRDVPVPTRIASLLPRSPALLLFLSCWCSSWNFR